MAKKYWKSQGILSVQKSGNLGLSTGGGGWYPSMHCSGFPACLATGGLQAHTWEGGGCVCCKMCMLEKSGNFVSPEKWEHWSVHRGGGEGVVSQHALQVVSQHALQQGGSPGPHLGRGGVSQHALRQTPPPVDGYCCGQYTSYWNAFFLWINLLVSGTQCM